jgi:mono/diheme cytochrome c family protein
LVLGLAALALSVLSGCGLERRKTDQELGLNPQQARGRRLYDRYCIRCHDPYSSRSLHGGSMQGVFQKSYLPSGAPANDERVRETVMRGRSKMPDFGQVLTEPDLQDLLAYLHTL